VAVAVLLLLWIGVAFITSRIADRKGRPEGVWFVLGLMFFLPALVAALVVSDQSKGPVAAASRWLRLVLRGDLRGAWLTTDHEFRLALARAWIGGKSVPPDAAESLASVAFDHPLWTAFEETQLREFADRLPRYNNNEWGAPDGSRPIGPDRELVVFVYTGGAARLYAEPTLGDQRIPVVVRHTGQEWVVAALWHVAGPDSVHPRLSSPPSPSCGV
jgi:hypothetical protein